MLNYAPRILLRFIVSFIKCLDYCGVMPKALNEASPFHGSMFISDLGSVRLPPVSHHLYDFGNLPLFICFGRKERRAELNREGRSGTA